MEPTSQSRRLLAGLHRLLLRLRLHFLLSLLPTPPFSLVALKDLSLSLLFLRHRLRPRSVRTGGATVHLWAPRRPRPSRPSLLLVHGFGGNAKWQWAPQVPALARSFNLYVPDLVFFGRSASDAGDYSIAFQAKCVAEAMRRVGVERYSVAGISYGGYVAYRMAAEAKGGEVDRVVILSSGVGASEEQRREMAGREERDVAEILLPERPEDLMALMRRSLYRPPNWMPAFLLQDFIQIMYKDRRKERVELLKELLYNGADLNPLPVLNQEMLILWGDKDNVFPMKLAHQLQRHLGQKARLEVIRDAGHALQLEKANIVNQLMEWFLLESDLRKYS